MTIYGLLGFLTLILARSCFSYTYQRLKVIFKVRMAKSFLTLQPIKKKSEAIAPLSRILQDNDLWPTRT